MKVKDPIALGTISGILATIPQLIINFIFVQTGISKYYSFQIAGGIYLNKSVTDNLEGFIFGGITWEMSSAILGTLIAFLILYTGKDYWWLKGVAVTDGLMFTLVYGLLSTLGASKVVPFDSPTNYVVLLDNTIIGLGASYLIVKIGDFNINKLQK